MVTVDQVRAVARDLPRSYEALVREHVKFRVGRIVWASVSPDETLLGFAFPKEERAGLVASDPDRFRMPLLSTTNALNWVRVVPLATARRGRVARAAGGRVADGRAMRRRRFASTFHEPSAQQLSWPASSYRRCSAGGAFPGNAFADAGWISTIHESSPA